VSVAALVVGGLRVMGRTECADLLYDMIMDVFVLCLSRVRA
jgi:hypothetical protein